MRKSTINLFNISFLLFLSCTQADTENKPYLKENAFPGFNIENDHVTLSGYIFTNNDLIKIPFTNCAQVLNYNISDIAEYNYFRFKLIRASCTALDKYKKASNSKKSYLFSNITKDNYKDLPALVTPYINNHEYYFRMNKTLHEAHENISFSMDNGMIKLLTNEDEFYLDIIARGDFDSDNIEDILISSEWYARNAHGKHNDLVILSKTGKDKPIEITWRMYGPNW